jgi:diguanylate cyclase (GGDEF)-like protein
MRRTHLRTRVLLLTAAFALVLFAITFGLSWRAKIAQQKWTHLLSVETEAAETFESIVRAQNAFMFRLRRDGNLDPLSYRSVEQLLVRDALRNVDTTILETRIERFVKQLEATRDEWSTSDEAARAGLMDELEVASERITIEAQRLAVERRGEIQRQLPELRRDSEDMMSAGLAVAWILVLLSFAAVQTTLRKVVRPIEELSKAADRIAAGDVTARAPIAGDYEIATLGTAFNRMSEELKARARTDDLTAMPNFRAFRERIDLEIDRASRYPQHFGMLVLDLDRFKQYNDEYGHLAGNDALQRVAGAVRETLRTVDFPARYGGEEFAIILPETEAPAVAIIADRVRAAIEAVPAPKHGRVVTVSIGAAMYPEDGASAEALFQVADERLYEAKRQGRNRVVSGGRASAEPKVG